MEATSNYYRQVLTEGAWDTLNDFAREQAKAAHNTVGFTPSQTESEIAGCIIRKILKVWRGEADLESRSYEVPWYVMPVTSTELLVLTDKQAEQQNVSPNMLQIAFYPATEPLLTDILEDEEPIAGDYFDDNAPTGE